MVEDQKRGPHFNFVGLFNDFRRPQTFVGLRHLPTLPNG